MTGIPLGKRLFLLTAAAIVPLALMAGMSLYALQRQHNTQAERVGRELARSVANAVVSRPQDRLRALAAGFNMNVPKPVDPGELTTIIADIIDSPERPQRP